MKKFRYNIVLQPEPEGGFTVTVPTLPGCVTYGKDIEDARRMAEDAIEGYLLTARKHKLDIPPKDNARRLLADFVEVDI